MRKSSNKSISYLTAHPDITAPQPSTLSKPKRSTLTANHPFKKSLIQQPQALQTNQNQLTRSSIVNRILANSQNKVVNQQVRPFSKKMQFNRKYSHGKNKTEGAITDEQRFGSSQARNIQKVYTEIVDQTTTSVKIKRSLTQLIPTYSRRKAKQLEDGNVCQISMSGLLSHNFRNVQSKNRLAFTSQGADQIHLEDTISESKKKARAAIIRSEHIHTKTDPSDTVKQDLEEAIASDYGAASTNDFLKAFMHQKRQSTMIYGQPQKQYVSLKRLSREVQHMDQAYFMIDKIKQLANGSKKTYKGHKKLITKVKKQQLWFQNRRQPSSSKRVKAAVINL